MIVNDDWAGSRSIIRCGHSSALRRSGQSMITHLNMYLIIYASGNDGVEQGGAPLHQN